MTRSMRSRSWAGRAAPSAGIGAHLPLRWCPAMVGGVVPLGALGVAALGAGRSLAGEGLGALRAAGDGPHPDGRAGRAALGVQLGDRGGAQGGVLLGAADPPEPLRLRARPDGQHILVELDEHGVQPARRGPPGARPGGCWWGGWCRACPARTAATPPPAPAASCPAPWRRL